MQVTIDIPEDLGPAVREMLGDNPGRALLERLAIEGYRSGELTRLHVQRLLGFADRWETERWLGRQGAAVAYGEAERQADRQTLDDLMGPATR